MPLSLPGVIAGSLLCFIPIVGEFVIPDLLGGSDTLMIGRTLWSEFFSQPRLAARRGGRGRRCCSSSSSRSSSIASSRRIGSRPRHEAALVAGSTSTALTFGFAFLYLPILILVVYSFNASQLVTVWGGFSTKWYAALLRNEALLDAAWVTIRIALLSATAATVLGTLAAVALVRYRRFRGRALFTGMVYAPLVMPEVITGLSLLLLFVALGLDRGFWTVTLAHITFTMCFVAVVVQSRLVTFDRSLEEAALDLGATPLRAFFSVTLPLILPAVAAGWLLAFTLSLDDLVIASFTSGPGATTLPMRIYSQVRLGVTPGDQRRLDHDDRRREPRRRRGGSPDEAQGGPAGGPVTYCAGAPGSPREASSPRGSAPRSWRAAPERWIRVRASGTIAMSLHGP